MNLVCNMMPMSVSSRYVQTFTPILMMISCLRLIHLKQHSVMIMVTEKTQMVYVLTDTSLDLEDSSNVQTISGMLHQIIDP